MNKKMKIENQAEKSAAATAAATIADLTAALAQPAKEDEEKDSRNAASPSTSPEDMLGESWIELSAAATMAGIKSPDRFTPLPFSSGEEYLRLLREAQRESNNSSRVVSLASSSRASSHDSPKSPPNSPNTEFCNEDDLRDIYINYYIKAVNLQKEKDILGEYNSRLEQQSPKDSKVVSPLINEQQKESGVQPPKKRNGYSMRLIRLGKNSLFSRETLYSLILTNVLSLLMGTGLGLWLSKRGILLTRVVLD